MRGKHWRRFLIVLLAAVMGLGILCGCQSNENTNEEDEAQGKFYTLTEAFENGLLTHEDIETIAYYKNSWGADKVEYPQKLDKKTEKEIKRAWAKRYGVSENEIIYTTYYGTYHGCVAIMFGGEWVSMDVVWEEEWEEIDGVRIIYKGPRRICIWKEN